MPKKFKQLNEFEQQNDQELIKMFNFLDTAGFQANVTVRDKNNNTTAFKGTAKKVELLINSGVRFHFDNKQLHSYQKLGLEVLYYLNEATMTCKTTTLNLNPGMQIGKELELDLLNSNYIINIKPI